MDEFAPVRLSARQREALFQTLEEAALPADAKVYLYGSRADLAARGGDVDLLVVACGADSAGIERRIRRGYRSRLEEHIDIVVADPDHPIAEQAAFLETVKKVRIR